MVSTYLSIHHAAIVDSDRKGGWVNALEARYYICQIIFFLSLKSLTRSKPTRYMALYAPNLFVVVVFNDSILVDVGGASEP